MVNTQVFVLDYSFIFAKYLEIFEPGIVVHACNYSTQEAELEDCYEFKASLSHIVEPCLIYKCRYFEIKKKKVGK